jgi:hypothetical protein
MSPSALHPPPRRGIPQSMARRAPLFHICPDFDQGRPGFVAMTVPCLIYPGPCTSRRRWAGWRLKAAPTAAGACARAWKADAHHACAGFPAPPPARAEATPQAAQAACAGRRPSRRAVTRQALGRERLLHSPVIYRARLSEPRSICYTGPCTAITHLRTQQPRLSRKRETSTHGIAS